MPFPTARQRRSRRNNRAPRTVLPVRTTGKEVPIEQDPGVSLARAAHALSRATLEIETAIRMIRRDPPDRRRMRALLELGVALSSIQRARVALAID